MGIRWLSGSAPDWRTDGHGFESMGSQGSVPGAKGVCDEIYGDKVICARELGRTKGNSLLSDPKPSTMRRSDLIRYAPGSCDRSRLHDRATTITSQSEKGWICYPSGIKANATQKSLSFPPQTSADCSTSVTIFRTTTSASILVVEGPTLFLLTRIHSGFWAPASTGTEVSLILRTKRLRLTPYLIPAPIDRTLRRTTQQLRLT